MIAIVLICTSLAGCNLDNAEHTIYSSDFTTCQGAMADAVEQVALDDKALDMILNKGYKFVVRCSKPL